MIDDNAVPDIDIEVTADSLRDAAGRFGEEVRAATDSLIEEQKARVAETAQGFARALQRTADAFAEEGGTVIAQCADRAAAQVKQFSESVRQQTWREALGSLEGAARRQPELFIAGAVAAGFLLGRFIAGSGLDGSAAE
jgi:ElaB/YqjD/DUF883 family membrane-anchored ribosome-binding protein